MIYLNKFYNKEKSRYELIIKNIDCGLNIYHFVKYDNVIDTNFTTKVYSYINDYFKDDCDSYKLFQLNKDVKNLCKEYNVINLRIERG
jgi:hypothetical protein